MFQIKVNGILMPTIYWTMREAMNACYAEEERGCAVRTEIVRGVMDIKTLNDDFRKSLLDGKVMLTKGIYSRGQQAINEILHRVKTFDNFNCGNDPYNEHDYGSFEYAGQKIMWKIDYYDKNLRYFSDSPEDVSKTIRVMMVMLAEEY